VKIATTTAVSVEIRVYQLDRLNVQIYRHAYGKDLEDVRRRVSDVEQLSTAINKKPQFSLGKILDDIISKKKSSKESASLKYNSKNNTSQWCDPKHLSCEPKRHNS